MRCRGSPRCTGASAQGAIGTLLPKERKMTMWKEFRRIFPVLLLGLSLSLAGCEGDDGDDGPAGPPGPPGQPGESVGAQARADMVIIPSQITAASVPRGGGQPTVTFTVQDENGQPVTTFNQESLAAGEVRFIIAKLLPPNPDGGEPANWQSYINQVERLTGTSPRLPSVPADNAALQATTESNGTLVHNGNGSYTYTFGTNLASVTNPLTGEAIPFQGDLTHRVAIQIEIEEEGEPVKMANPTFDFVPAGGTVQPYRVAKTADCNECHDLLVAHGARFEIDYCVTCHNPFSFDANSGNTVDMPVMVHKIHMGRELPSVIGADDVLGTADDGRYVIWGFRNSEHDYSDVGYPQDVRYCTKCHQQGEATPQGNNWRTEPTIANCGSCHDDVIFNPTVQGIPDPAPAFMHQHPAAFPVTDAQCAACHPAEGAGAGGSVTSAHNIPADAASANFQFNILGTTFNPDRTLDVRFSVTNPNAGGAAYDIKANPAFTTGGGVSTLALLVGWSPQEFHNTGSGANPAQPLRINLLTAVAPAFTANGDGTYTIRTAAIPAGVTSVGVGIEGHPAAADAAGAFTLRVPVRNAFTTVATGGAVQTRRQNVSIDKCNVCHNILSIHGNNRTNNIEVCTMCHNPNATDVARRPAGAPTGTPDNRAEESIDFKTMIHAIHGNQIRENTITLYGFGGAAHEFGGESASNEAVLYPGILQNCNKCHVEDGFDLPLENYVLATTTTSLNNASPLDDTNTTPATAVCSSCHDNPAAIAHMTQNGGLFNLVGNALSPPADPSVATSTTETCNICHASERLAPVEEVHALFEVPVPAPEPVPGAGNIPAPPPLTRPPEEPPATPPPAEPPPPATPPGPDLAAGQLLYDSQCAGCHTLGTYDTAGFAPNLSGREGAVGSQFPTPGAPGAGPHSALTLSAAELTNLTAFITAQ